MPHRLGAGPEANALRVEVVLRKARERREREKEARALGGG